MNYRSFVTAWMLAWSLHAGRAGEAWGGDPSFAAAPRAVRTAAGGFALSFAASAPTDCEVAILDAGGRIVRRLAAGVLGPNAPEPLRKNSLEQSIEWDGLDDTGVVATNAPFSARISLGARPVFDRVIGAAPGVAGRIVAIAAHPRTGELFVFHCFGDLHPDDGSVSCMVLDHTGKYLRTIYPWPANLGEKQLAGLTRVDIDGRKVPYVYNAETRALLPGAGELALNRPVVTADGMLVFVGHQEVASGFITRYNHPGMRQVLAISAADGSMSGDGPLRTILADRSQSAIMLALAPDERTFYAAGVAEGYADKAKNPHAVYRFLLDDAKAKVFVGDPATSGGGETRLHLPVDVAVDRDANVLVADRGNDRVAAFKADGSFLREWKVEKPKRVMVSRKSGAIYVLAGDEKTNQLFRFDPGKPDPPAAQLKLPDFRYPKPILACLDDSGATPAVWVASPGGRYANPPFTLLRIADAGDALAKPVEVYSPASGNSTKASPAVGPVRLLAMDRVRNRVLINGWVYDPATGALSEGIGRVIRASDSSMGIGAKGGMGGMGLDGNLYLMGYSKWLRRFEAGEFNPLPFGAGKEGVALQGPEGAESLRLRARGATADRAGNIYAVWQYPDKTAPGYGDRNCLTLHGPDGTVRTKMLIDSEIRPIGSPRLDGRGNIYLAVGVRPQGKLLPDSLASQSLGRPWAPNINTHAMNWYPLLYGSIVKFGPEGGMIRQQTGGEAGGGGAVPVTSGLDLKTTVHGAKYIFFGASPVPSWRQKAPDTCLCESPSIDVDGFGRCLFPDAARFRVGLLDTNGNLICWVGTYGNADSAGPNSPVPTPEFPLLWPDNVALGDDAIYIGDRLNRRVVTAKLGYAMRETVRLK